MPFNEVRLPGWFLWVMSAMAGVLTAGAIPWATWITYTLIGLQASLPTVTKNTESITELRKITESHDAQFQVIAATRFTAADGRSIETGINNRLDRLEGKIDGLQREFDRSGTWGRTSPPSRPPTPATKPPE